MRGERIEVYEDKSGEWRWRKIAGNNERTADSGEGYETYHGAFAAAERERKHSPEIPIHEAEE